MKTKRCLFLILFVLPLVLSALSLPIPVICAETTDYTVIPCQDKDNDPWAAPMKAYVGDKDPSGLNVRSGPGMDYPILTTLPTDRTVVVTITGSTGGWFRIDYVWICNKTSVTRTPLVGWVSGALLQLPVDYEAGLPLLSDPRNDAAIVTVVPEGAHLTLSGCGCGVYCGWLKVRYGKFEGYVSGGSVGIGEEFCGP
jgi:hypothetical protein